ncbi:hypothetical protein AVEN_249304-1 [Araneus ventricosus]|uniref:Uncharacterized protein n=1 Tax=Araneus ventricosus TaxID=182803 RepID=A0A4Y2NX14_ARAVE|nr:hypothetical protein AVEN_249304-1 [Araneus ventricosus]
MNIICQFRKSKNFTAERPSAAKFTSCCHKLKIKLEKPSDALSSMGTNLVDLSVENHTYSKFMVRCVITPDQSENDQTPQYAQLYMIDITQATKIRVNHPADV